MNTFSGVQEIKQLLTPDTPKKKSYDDVKYCKKMCEKHHQEYHEKQKKIEEDKIERRVLYKDDTDMLEKMQRLKKNMGKMKNFFNKRMKTKVQTYDIRDSFDYRDVVEIEFLIRS